MKWPWVSRRAFDVVVEERDRLRDQTDQLLDHLKRIDRIEHGVGELPRKPRPEIGPMPPELKEYIDGNATPALRREVRRSLYKKRLEGESWESLVAQLGPKESDAEAHE